eukprot:7125003-Pyramimonas_sp.AAC.1
MELLELTPIVSEHWLDYRKEQRTMKKLHDAAAASGGASEPPPETECEEPPAKKKRSQAGDETEYK